MIIVIPPYMLVHLIQGLQHPLNMLLHVPLSIKLNGKIYEAYDSMNNGLRVEQFNLTK